MWRSLSLFFLSSLAATDFTANIEGGFFNSDFHWDIGRFDQVGSVISELEWKDLTGPYGLVSLRGDFPFKGFALVEGSYGVSSSGRVIDSDYYHPFRQGLFLRTVANAAGSPFWGLRGVVGHSFTSPNAPWLRLDLSFGYRFERETFRLDGEGEVIVSRVGPVSLEGLRSRFMARWVGFEGNAGVALQSDNLSLTPSISIFFPSYTGKGYWNLRDKIVGPFYHSGNGMGYDFRLQGAYQIANVMLGLNFRLLTLRLHDGIDTTWVIEDGTVIGVQGRLNKTAFNSRMYTATLAYAF